MQSFPHFYNAANVEDLACFSLIVKFQTFNFVNHCIYELAKLSAVCRYCWPHLPDVGLWLLLVFSLKICWLFFHFKFINVACGGDILVFKLAKNAYVYGNIYYCKNVCTIKFQILYAIELSTSIILTWK